MVYGDVEALEVSVRFFLSTSEVNDCPEDDDDVGALVDGRLDDDDDDDDDNDDDDNDDDDDDDNDDDVLVVVGAKLVVVVVVIVFSVDELVGYFVSLVSVDFPPFDWTPLGPT